MPYGRNHFEERPHMDGPATLVPIFGIFMIIAVVIGPIWITSYFRSRERAELHQTLRAAYDKGLPPPPELIEKLAAAGAGASVPHSPDYDLRRAVILICVGVGLVLLGLGLGFGISQADAEGGWITGASVAGAGAIPGLIGVGHLFLWITRRNAPKP